MASRLRVRVPCFALVLLAACGPDVPPDDGAPDAGPAAGDAGPADAGGRDAGPADAGARPDAGAADAGAADAGAADAGTADAGTARGPTLAAIAAQTVGEAAVLEVALSATDPDAADLLRFCKEAGPGWATVTGTGTSPAAGVLRLAPGANHAGDYTVRVRVIDAGTCADPSGLSDALDVTVHVTQTNSPPVLDSVSDQSLGEDSAMSVPLSATDPDSGQTLTFCKASGPAWAVVTGSGASPASGVLALQPGPNDAGDHEVRVRVLDAGTCEAPGGTPAEGVVVVHVQATNSTPALATVAAQSMGEDSGRNVPLSATDADNGQTLTFCKVSGPPWAVVDGSGASPGPVAGMLRLSPGANDAGSYEISVRVIDAGTCAAPAGGQASRVVAVTVTATNSSPVLAAVAPQSVPRGAERDVPLSATDGDTDQTLTFCKVSGPDWATVTGEGDSPGPVAGTLHLAPAADDGGTESVVVRVIDQGTCEAPAGASSQATVVVTVTPPSAQPVLAPVAPVVLDEGAVRDVALSATDTDAGQTLRFCKVSGPDWATVSGQGASPGPVAGVLHLAPGQNDGGTDTVTLRVIDDGTCAAPAGMQAQATVSITVNAVNVAPQIAPVLAQTVTAGTADDVDLTASDADEGQTLRFCKVSGPAWASVTGEGPSPGPVTGVLELAPGATDLGSFSVAVKVIDGGTCAAPTGLSAQTTVSVTVQPGLATGDTCAGATTIGAGRRVGESTVGLTNDYDETGDDCTGYSSAGPDRVYRLVVPAGNLLSASVTRDTAAWDPAIYLIAGPATACDASPIACLDGDDSGAGDAVNRVSWRNTSASAAEVFLVVDASSSTGWGTYTLDTSLTAPPSSGDTCQAPDAPTVPVGSTPLVLNTTTVGFFNDYFADATHAVVGCEGTGGLDRVWRVSVGNDQRLTASVLSTTTDYDPSVSLIRGPASACSASPRVCVASDDSGGATTKNTASWTNRTGAAAEVFVVADSYRTTDTGGTLVLELLLEAVAPLPTGDVCQSPAATTPGTATGDTTTASNDYAGGQATYGCVDAAGGKDRVHLLAVPAGKRLSASVTSGFDTTLNLIAAPAASCDASPLSCLRSADDYYPGANPESVRYTNAGTDAADVFLVIDGAGSTDVGAYTLQTALDDPPQGDVCQNAVVVATSGTLSNQTLAGYGNDYPGGLAGTNCHAATWGPDRVYSIDVPSGQRLSATVTPAAGADATLLLIAGPASACDARPRTCLGGVDAAGTGGAETLGWLNGTGVAQTVLIVVDSPDLDAFTFSLQTTLTTPPAGETCAGATPIAAPGTLANQTLVGYANNYGAGTNCEGTAGPDRVYSIVVPNGKELDATVTPNTLDWDPSISLVLGPASACEAVPRTCLAGEDWGGDGEPDEVWWTNDTGSDKTVFIVVDCYSASEAVGSFSLTTALANPSP